jgi:GR25 family glycosyltransferase involved in LPS biosynthesis
MENIRMSNLIGAAFLFFVLSCAGTPETEVSTKSSIAKFNSTDFPSEILPLMPKDEIEKTFRFFVVSEGISGKNLMTGQALEAELLKNGWKVGKLKDIEKPDIVVFYGINDETIEFLKTAETKLKTRILMVPAIVNDHEKALVVEFMNLGTAVLIESSVGAPNWFSEKKYPVFRADFNSQNAGDFAVRIHKLYYGNIEEKQDAFMFVLNLDRSKGRMENARKQLLRENINYVRIPAVDGKMLDLKDLEERNLLQFVPERTGRKLTPGEVGCTLSHRKFWYEVIRRKLPIAIVLEDDFQISAGFLRSWEKILEDVPQDWDILYLGCRAQEESGCHAQKTNTTLDGKFTIVTENCDPAAHAYAVNQRSARKLAEASLPVMDPSDGYIARDFLAKGFKAYCANPELITQGGFESDIGAR